MKTLGYLGLGVMGYGMTGNLIDKSGCDMLRIRNDAQIIPFFAPILCKPQGTCQYKVQYP